MKALRFLLAWAFYGLGDLIWRICDEWIGCGMRWGLYRLYSGAMNASDSIQGDGPGPWLEPKQ